MIPHPKHDVFLSFRGKDVRHNFVSHLNAALCREKIETFIDDKLNRGNEISPSLSSAIEGSKISIVIFSEGYASSRWCLNELVKILESKNKSESVLIEGNVNDISKKLSDLFPSDNKDQLVGVESIIKEIESQLLSGSTEFNTVGFLELSNIVIKYANGVPLALQVLGSYLKGMSEEEWESAVTKLKRMPHMDIQKVLKGSEEIEGISLDMFKIKEICLNPRTFRKMRRLRFLKFYNLIPGENKCKNLAVLKRLNLSYSKQLFEIPDLSLALNLEQLNLEGCTSLFEIHSSIQHLNKLVILNLGLCTSLKSLPTGINLDSLKELYLGGCSNLKRFPEISCNIEDLDLKETAIEELPSSIGNLSRLVDLDLTNYHVLLGYDFSWSSYYIVSVVPITRSVSNSLFGISWANA
ncbi:hypothetical protein WN944_024172 [Citrus x changshan-huyou]|uniref:TIR domain-containing protein n=1 Tax=Citrus x changshan-huyou TaxID=2935761 RepID=A0AAP0LTQ1_9ROSI